MARGRLCNVARYCETCRSRRRNWLQAPRAKHVRHAPLHRLFFACRPMQSVAALVSAPAARYTISEPGDRIPTRTAASVTSGGGVRYQWVGDYGFGVFRQSPVSAPPLLEYGLNH